MEGGRFQTANVVGVGGVEEEMCVTPLDANIRFYFSILSGCRTAGLLGQRLWMSCLHSGLFLSAPLKKF